MTAARALEAWPSVVWDAPVLRAIDARGRREIEAAGGLRALVAGDAVFRAGEPADALFVVAEGAVDVRAVRRGEREASVIRRAGRGDVVGEEATLGAGARTMDAVCTERGSVAIVPVSVLRRAAGRGVEAVAVAKLERTLRRAASADLLRTMSFGRDLERRDVEALLDAVEHVRLARGEALFRPGDRPTCAYFVADGMLQLRSEDDERLHVRAYVARGDLLGDEELESGAPRDLAAVALGPAWVLAVPREAMLGIAQRAPDALARARRVARAEREAQLDVARGANATQHVMRDLHRVSEARSLLVIDQDACVRCGHCAWSCASAHDDGVSRLVRRGDKIVTDASSAAVLLPNSCQHCENPACMIDCPTGAIGRDPRGDVFIREELCIGCGNCAKSCPWENVQMAPRAKRRLPLVEARPAPRADEPSALVAVKCDLCRDVDGGPACVRACPTDAIVRIRPSEVLPELAAVRGGRAQRALPSPRPAWPSVVGASATAIAIARAASTLPRSATGAAIGALVLLAAAYALVKRFPSRRASSARVEAPRSRVRVAYVAHLALGALVAGVAFAHAGARLAGGVAGALELAFAATIASGALVGAAYAVVPKLLSRIERRGALPEDLAGRAREIDERIFGALSGRSDVVKALFAGILRPYASSPLGGFAIVLRGASLRDEERRARARVDRALAGRAAERLHGLDELVRLVVERRAVGAQRALLAILRAALPLHLVATAVALVLVVAHVVAVTRGR